MHFPQLYFNQDCPVCGRRVKVRIELLGTKIACSHCTAVMVASDNHDRTWYDSPRISGQPTDAISQRDRESAHGLLFL